MIKLSEQILAVLASGGTVIVPSRQRAEAMRLGYADAALGDGSRVWITPDILPLDAWLAREIAVQAAGNAELPRFLGPAEEWLLWRETTATLTAELELIARAPLAESLRRAEQLAFEFSIDFDAARDGSTEQILLRDAARAVRARQRELDAALPSRLAATLPHIGDARPVLIAGFCSLSPQLASLIAARRAKGWETQVLPRGAAGRLQVVIASDAWDELERIARWCGQRLAARSDARLLIMLPGNANVRQQLDALLRQTLDPRTVMGVEASGGTAVSIIEGGEPLNDVPMAAHALASLEWLIGTEAFEAFSERLRSPYWVTPDLAARCRLDLDLRERAPLEMGVREALDALALVPESRAQWAGELSERIRQARAALGFGAATLREWSTRFHLALQALGWPGSRIFTSEQQQTHERFLELLKEFGSLSASWGPIGCEKALRWFRDLAERTNFSPARGDAPITISPTLGDPIVRYDGVWVGGLTAAAWPQAVQSDPFLTVQAQLTAGVPSASAAGRLAAARDLMVAWSAAADELILSSATRDGDMEILPSALLKDFAAAPPIQTRLPMELPVLAHRDGILEQFSDAIGQPWNSTVPLPAGTRSIELQNECPFRAYGELRLGGARMDAAEPGIAADVRGNLLHRALEALWDRLQGSPALMALSDEACDELILTCVDRAATSLWGPVSSTPAQMRERRRARRLIATLCRLERGRAPFSVKSRELKVNLVLGEARLRLQIDRLDELADSSQIVLDYKSGRRATADWYGERPSHVQLLGYLAALDDRVQAIATVNVTAREVRFDGLAATAGVLPKVSAVRSPDGAVVAHAWNLRRAEWLGRLQDLASEFLAGHAAVDPRAHACDFCHLAALCRIGDLGRMPAEEETGDE